MKKILVIGFAVVALASVASYSSVHAQMGYGGYTDNGSGHMGNGHMGNGNGHGGHGGCYGGTNSNTPVITESDANVKVNEYIKNLKGYKLNNIETFQSRRGHTAFIANVEDSSGNKFIIKVSPYGHIRGPIANMNANTK